MGFGQPKLEPKEGERDVQVITGRMGKQCVCVCVCVCRCAPCVRRAGTRGPFHASSECNSCCAFMVMCAFCKSKVLLETETALRSQPCGHRAQTYTHIPFSLRPGITWTSSSPSFGFHFGRPNPKDPTPDHPGGAGSKPIGRKSITCTKAPFSRSSSCVLYPRHTTHIRAPAFSFTLATTIAHTDRTHFKLRLFDFPFPNTWCNRTPHPASELLGFALFSFSILPEQCNPESEPQEPGQRRQKPGPA